ncbi:MAG: nitrous oxide reductase family maturation protein NosD [bacterium]
MKGKRFIRKILIFSLFFLFSSQGYGADFFVPDDFPTIQEAIEVAEFGDTVRVRPGVYYERIIIKEGLSLVSDGGPDGERLVKGPGEKQVFLRAMETIIDGSRLNPPDYLISFQKESRAPMRLNGFTVRHLPPSAIDKLFLIEVRGCSPVIENNIICLNHSKGKGGGILLTGLGPSMGPPLETTARPVVKNNVIYNNHGPGISNGSNSFSIIEDNEIFNNHFPRAKDTEQDAPGIGMREYARPQIRHNLCYQNGSGIGGLALINHDQPIMIQGNILRHNQHAGIGMRTLDKQQENVSIFIEDNEIYGNLRSGLWLAYVTESTIKNNRIYHNLRAGIALQDVQKTSIIQNTIFGNLAVGLIIDAREALIAQNQIYHNLDTGINILPYRESERSEGKSETEP